MATEVASAYVSIGASTKGLGKSINKEFAGVEQSAGKTGAAVASKFVAPLAAALAGLGIGKFFAGAVNEASDLNEAGTALKAVFGDSVGAVDNFAKGGAKALGQTELAVKQAAQTFGVYGKAAGLANDANATFSTDLVGLSTDLASFYNADPSEVVAALGSGLRGEAEPLRQFGILLDDATLKAKAMELGIYDGNGSLTQQQKILAAQASIMDQSSIAQGDFAKTSEGLANQQRILSATWTNFAGALGTTLLPYVTSFVSVANDLASSVLPRVADGFAAAAGWLDGWIDGFRNVESAGDFFDTLSATVESAIGALLAAAPGFLTEFVPKMVEGLVSRYALIIDAVAGIVTAVLDLLPRLLPLIVGGAVQLFGGLITAITTIMPSLIATVTGLIPTIVSTLVSLLPVLLDGALTLFNALVGAVVLIVPPLLAAILGMLPGLLETVLGMLPALLETALMLFMAIVTAVLDMLPTLIDTVLTMLPQVIETLLGMLPKLIDSALTLFLGIVTGLLDMLPTLIRSLLGMLPKIISTLLAMIPELLDGAIRLFTGIVDALPEIIPELLDATLALLPEIVGTLLGMVPDLIDAGIDLIGGLVTGLWDAAGSVGSALLDIAKNAIGGFLSFLGINSPSRLFAEYGGYVGEGFVQGVDGMRRDAERSLLGLASATPDLNASRADMATVGAASASPGISRADLLDFARIIASEFASGAADIADGRADSRNRAASILDRMGAVI